MSTQFEPKIGDEFYYPFDSKAVYVIHTFKSRGNYNETVVDYFAYPKSSDPSFTQFAKIDLKDFYAGVFAMELDGKTCRPVPSVLEPKVSAFIDEESPRGRLYARHKELCKEALSLMTKKNHDYAGKAGDDPYFNFRRSELMGICKTETGFMVRITDKFSRLITFINDGELKVKEESVRDIALDLINYTVLLYSFISENQGCNPCLTNSQKLTSSPNLKSPDGNMSQSTEQK